MSVWRTDQDRGLSTAIALSLCAMTAAVLLLVAAMPRMLTVGALVLAIAAAASSLALAFVSAHRNRVRSRVFQELLAQAAHQLRTPTATLVMEIDSALADPRLDTEGRGLALRFSEQVNAQKALIERLLAYARLEARAERPRWCGSAVVDDALRILTPVADARRVALSVELQSDAVFAREHELKELLVILGENAILHGGGPVRIRIRTEPRASVIDVFDAGDGIHTDAHGAVLRADGGAGLGLELATRIVARQRGTLTLDPRSAAARNGDPTVTVRLPHRKGSARHRR